MAKILIIDDDDTVRKSLQIVLQGAGFTITATNSGRKGIAIAQAESFDLIILADVLYYLGDQSKGYVYEKSFMIFCQKVASWMIPSGRLLLAHCFGNERDLALREGYARQFERCGLRTIAHKIAGESFHDKGQLRCHLQLLEKPASTRLEK